MLALAVVGVALALRWPWAALAFAVVGAIPYFATLHVLGVGTSGVLTGSVFGGLGLTAVLRLMLRPKSFHNLPFLFLFLAFVAFWYLRWYTDPPQAGYLSDDNTFAARAPVFMLASAIVPFVGGLLVRTEKDLRDILFWVATWGCMGMMVILIYWVLGMPNLGPSWSSKWEPIPSLTGIILALEVGFGALAFTGISMTRRGWRWLLLRLVVLGTAIAISVRVGQRGPFVFLVVAVLAPYILQVGSRLRQGLLVGATTLVLLVVVATETSESYSSDRATAAKSYSADSNQNRLDLIKQSLRVFRQRPILGWGGSLTGQTLGSERFYYTHVSLLDPLVETGIVGALLYWGLYFLVLRILLRKRNMAIAGGTVFGVIVPLFLFTFLEAQVSGHVSGLRHLWLVTGMIGALPAVASMLSARQRQAKLAGANLSVSTFNTGTPHSQR